MNRAKIITLTIRSTYSSFFQIEVVISSLFLYVINDNSLITCDFDKGEVSTYTVVK